jgi:hypothetical protein
MKYPELTPYQYASNRPIDGIDLDGLEYFKASEKHQKSLYGVNKWEPISTDYTMGNVAIRNTEIHNKVMEHPANSAPWESYADAPGEANDMVVKKRASSAKAQAFSNMEASTARKEGIADVVGGGVDLIKWGITAYFDHKYKDEMEYAGSSVMALSLADGLVRSAVQNSTFPDKLKNTAVLTDLTNYITDHTIPKDAEPYYQQVIIYLG